MKPLRLSIGSWAFCFGPYKDKPVPFDTVLEKVADLGFDGVELGAFAPYPCPKQFDTKARRAELRKRVTGLGLEFSGLAVNLWPFPIITQADNSNWISVFENNVEFAYDLGIDLIRVDSVSPPDIFDTQGIDPKLVLRLENTFTCRAALQGGMPGVKPGAITTQQPRNK